MLKYSYIVAICFLIYSCTKQVPGPKGQTGSPGLDGNTIETHTSAITKDSMDWKVNSGIWETTVYIPELSNNDIYNECEVKVYLDVDSTWWVLPRIEKDYITKYSIMQGYVKLNSYKFHGAPGHRPPTENFRIVLLYPAQ